MNNYIGFEINNENDADLYNKLLAEAKDKKLNGEPAFLSLFIIDVQNLELSGKKSTFYILAKNGNDALKELDELYPEEDRGEFYDIDRREVHCLWNSEVFIKTIEKLRGKNE